jgi:hypothetical protein
MNSGNFTRRTAKAAQKPWLNRYSAAIKAQDGISLSQQALSAQAPKRLAGIEVLIVLRYYNSLWSKQA